MNTDRYAPIDQAPFPIRPSWNSSLGFVWTDSGWIASQFMEKLGVKYARRGRVEVGRDLFRTYYSEYFFDENNCEIAHRSGLTDWFCVLHTPRTWGKPMLDEIEWQ